MPKITAYDFIESNTRKTMLLMTLFPSTLAALVYLCLLFVSFIKVSDKSMAAYNLSAFAVANETAIYIIPIISILAILWILISYYAGQSFILSTAGAVELTIQNAPEVVRIVENIAIAAGLPMPKIYSINDEGLNAFATGRDPNHSYVVLTKGIINNLEKPELEGVVAHEMAHIGNRDVRLMLIMIVCISFATVVAEILLRMALITRTSGNSKNNNNAIQAFLFVLAISLYMYGYLVAPLIKLAVSRTREYHADATAALITRNPKSLISALQKISGHSTVKNLSDKQTISPICIANPLAKNKQNSFFAKVSGLFATHPPVENRIKALQAMDGTKYENL
ncbi:MAG: M48 family metallopeptidase [Endomicrobium sp.]|jgi:heat shock protein HtpX|nr:M48 family metallopeptidase [Endomicrobium sp.]